MGDRNHHRTLFSPCPAMPVHWVACVLFLVLGSGCSFREATPTRTPFPTWTPTVSEQPSVNTPVAELPATPTATLPPPPPADTPVPAEPTPIPTETPTETPAESPTPEPTNTPADTPTPEPTATVAFRFVLEAAEKFPTDSLTANVVRIYLYVYAPETYGLADYTLQVTHNGSALTVDKVSTAGVPVQTRNEPGPYTRFANLDVVFVEPQAGRWDIQLLDPQQNPAGPPVTFELTADEVTRELYVRYRQEGRGE
ncbi:MAG: hypothetical protein KF832_20125 [Caldilineaceae bacterium]|nr:hypothetical protein [Caldilineaceae bacterium]